MPAKVEWIHLNCTNNGKLIAVTSFTLTNVTKQLASCGVTNKVVNPGTPVKLTDCRWLVVLKHRRFKIEKQTNKTQTNRTCVHVDSERIDHAERPPLLLVARVRLLDERDEVGAAVALRQLGDLCRGNGAQSGAFHRRT